MMDHDSIIKDNTAERYLLHELNETESDAFEEHYFECQECAERVRCGSELMDYGRDVAREEFVTPPVPAQRRWKNLMFTLQAGALVAMLGAGIFLYQKIHVNVPVQQAALQDVYVHLEAAKGEAPLNGRSLGVNQRPVLSFG